MKGREEWGREEKERERKRERERVREREIPFTEKGIE
jgi:hypothetical protein